MRDSIPQNKYLKKKNVPTITKQGKITENSHCVVGVVLCQLEKGLAVTVTD